MPKVYNILPLFILGFFDYIFFETEVEMLKPGESISVGWYVSLGVVNIIAFLWFRAIFKAGYDYAKWPSDNNKRTNRNHDNTENTFPHTSGTHIHITIKKSGKD